MAERVEDAAQWWLDNRERFYAVQRWLLETVRAGGPIPLDAGGALGFQSDGFSWDSDAVAVIMPTLIKHAEVTFAGPIEHIERTIEMVTEEFPKIDYTVKRTVDRVRANGVLKDGGEAAAKLLPYRVNKTKLGRV